MFSSVYKKLVDVRLIRSDGRLNTAVIRRDSFKSSNIFKNIVDITSFLPDGSTLVERVFCIKNNISDIENIKCVCGNKLKWQQTSNSYAKTCGNIKCFTSTSQRIIGYGKTSKIKLENNSTSFNEFIKTYACGCYKLYDVVDIITFINDNINSIIRHGIHRNYQFKHNVDFLCSIIKHTESMVAVDYNDLRLNERCYIIKNTLPFIPKCGVCGSSMSYRNFKTGYYCPDKICYLKTAQEVKHKNKQDIVSKILSKHGFILKSDHMLNESKAVLHCLECDQDFEYWIRNGKSDKVICPMCHCKNEEESLFEFIKSIYSGEIIRCYKMPWTKNKTAYQELDIYLPELKIAFEYDGVYWHSDIDKNYHLNKTESCLKNGIRLYHIFSNEWIDLIKQNIWKSMISSILNKSKRVFARKCEIVVVDKPAEFLVENHLQGSCKPSISYGLRYGDELVCIATFGKARYSKQYDFELLRFCNKLNMNVIGGFSRLLAHFRKNHKGSIVTYADRRISCGNVYERNDFKFSHASQPNYFYWRRDVWHGREHFQKHKLSSLLEKFDSSLTEYDNMRANGWHRIHDCGNLVYHIGGE